MFSFPRLTDDDFPLDRRSCQLLGPTALVVQALMGVLAILSLVYKRHREPQKRPWRIWLFDVSKQIVGQMFVHGVNVLISDLGSHHNAGNACTYYFLNVLIDTTLGVAIIYVVHHGLTYLLAKRLQLKGYESGQYGSPPSIAYWARQAAVYVFALTTMKMIVVGLFAAWPGISKVGDWLLSWTAIGDGDAFQVIFAMGLFPIIMNILQFWLIDSIVKASSSSAELPTNSPRMSDVHDREPLFRAPEDDEDEDDDHCDIENPRPTYIRMPTGDDAETIVVSEDFKGKDSGTTSPLSIPKSSTPSSLVPHDYPPSVGSLSSHSSRSRHKYKRSPPPPLEFHTSHMPAINSPDPPRSHQADVDRSSSAREDRDGRLEDEERAGTRTEQTRGIVSKIWRHTLGSL
ncbi:vacuolar membrane protein-domain-containing protein [Suillus clintonianus]|uniref:vacuolar membrane protein-domain-containing protein n=1 Tax=Suillus clintonianus TaxID=1904413 RepID=UPI001B86BF87|nr:vacuolar membrane protein-domain-containing protein [Suillus clintonianus]KAG2128988.1 vacuolar membrane protein-domain-containing protein [Suillus clintonianus]